jgi:hypothetical protein
LLAYRLKDITSNNAEFSDQLGVNGESNSNTASCKITLAGISNTLIELMAIDASMIGDSATISGDQVHPNIVSIFTSVNQSILLIKICFVNNKGLD